MGSKDNRPHKSTGKITTSSNSKKKNKSLDKVLKKAGINWNESPELTLLLTDMEEMRGQAYKLRREIEELKKSGDELAKQAGFKDMDEMWEDIVKTAKEAGCKTAEEYIKKLIEEYGEEV